MTAAAPREPWTLVPAAFFAVMLSFASVFIYTFGIFLKPLTEEFSWTRAQVSLGFTIAALTVAAASPMIGRLADRLGVRPVVVVCALAFGLGFASLSLLDGRLWRYYLSMFLIGVFANGTTQLTWARAITASFDSRRGLALSLMMAGVGVGSMLMPWVATVLIRDHGWRFAYASFGLTVVATAPLLAVISLRHERPTAKRTVEHSAPAATRAFRSRPFRLLLLSFFLLSLGVNGVVAHLAPLLTDRRLSLETAAMALSVLGVCSVTGRLVTGWLLDRYFAPRIGFLFVMGSGVGLALLMFETGAPLALFAAGLVGLAMGAEADVFPYMIGRYMGIERFGELYGYAFTVYAISGGLSPLLMGSVYDAAQSYTAALATATAATCAGGALLLLLPTYRRPDSDASEPTVRTPGATPLSASEIRN